MSEMMTCTRCKLAAPEAEFIAVGVRASARGVYVQMRCPNCKEISEFRNPTAAVPSSQSLSGKPIP